MSARLRRMLFGSHGVSFWNAGARADADESPPPDPGSNRVISTTEVMEMKALRTFAALLLALGVLTTASAAFADRGDDPQSLRGEQPEDIQASYPRGRAGGGVRRRRPARVTLPWRMTG
jgi:hypothetical protein